MFLYRLLLPPPFFTLFPYTTLFRSGCVNSAVDDQRVVNSRAVRPHPRCALRGAPRALARLGTWVDRSEEHTSELQSPCRLVCRLLLEKKKREGARGLLYKVSRVW